MRRFFDDDRDDDDTDDLEDGGWDLFAEEGRKELVDRIRQLRKRGCWGDDDEGWPRDNGW
jgi:hypothetical protein